MAITANDIRVFLTGISNNGTNYDGCCSQDNPNQSLGGFRSSTEMNGTTVLSAAISATDTVIQIDEASDLPGASTINPGYAVIGDEIVSYVARSTSLGPAQLLGVTRGLYGRVATAHDEGAVITGLTSQNLYDNVKATENETGDVEYRCFAVQNTNSSDSAFNVRVYLSPVSFEGFVDTAVADTGTGAVMQDNDLIALYEDNFFVGGTMTITGGDGESLISSENIYTITKSDIATGEITIDGNWSSGTPNGTTSYILESLNTTPNPDSDIEFAIERHKYASLGDGSGVATTGGTNFVIDSTLPTNGWSTSTDFLGAYILLLTGDGVDGVPRRITAYNEATGQITVSDFFVNEGATSGDLYTIVRGPSDTLLANESVPPPVGTGNLSVFVKPTTADNALSIDINSIGEDLIHDELFFIWTRRTITPNESSFLNDNAIPNILFEI